MKTPDDVLAHFGVKGMRWGVVRSNPGASTASEDHARAKEIKKKARFGQTKKLSNDEMRILIERMNLEQQLKNLKRQRPEGEAKGLIKEVLKDAGKQELRKFAADVMVKQIAAMFRR